MTEIDRRLLWLLYRQAKMLCLRLNRRAITVEDFQMLMTQMIICPYADIVAPLEGLTPTDIVVQCTTDLREQIRDYVEHGASHLFSLTSSGSFVNRFDPNEVAESLAENLRVS